VHLGLLQGTAPSSRPPRPTTGSSFGPPRRLLWGLIGSLIGGLGLLLPGGCGLDSATSATVTISDARIRTPAPGQDKTAAYFDIHNGTDTAITLVGAASPMARAVEMHQIVRDGDMVRMRRQTVVVVPAGETVRFAPGGLHLMVFGVSSPVDGAEFVLQADDGRSISARFKEIGLGAQQ